MNSPCTAWPARCSSSAATAESTPPDMPTMTVPASLGSGRDCIRPLYGRSRGSGARGARGALRLHEHLSHLRFLHARLPDLVEEIQVAADDRGIVHVGDTVPPVRLQSVHQGLIVRDDECAGARRILGAHGPQID